MTVPRHPLFRAMVTMGGAITLGCGGVTNTGSSKEGEPGGGGDGGKSPDGAGGTSGGNFGAPGGSFNASGGRPMMGTGGSVFVGAGGQLIIVANGGSAGQPEPVPLPCPPAQWRCGDQSGSCRGGGGFYTPDPASCSCDLKAPVTAADCAAGEARICRQLATDGPTPNGADHFDCRCVPDIPSDADTCNTMCLDAFPDIRSPSFYCQNMVQSANHRDILCGCAVIVLR